MNIDKSLEQVTNTTHVKTSHFLGIMVSVLLALVTITLTLVFSFAKNWADSVSDSMNKTTVAVTNIQKDLTALHIELVSLKASQITEARVREIAKQEALEVHNKDK